MSESEKQVDTTVKPAATTETEDVRRELVDKLEYEMQRRVIAYARARGQV